MSELSLIAAAPAEARFAEAGEPLRVLVASADASLVATLVRGLPAGTRVLSECRDARSTAFCLAAQKPDALVLDWSLAGPGGRPLLGCLDPGDAAVIVVARDAQGALEAIQWGAVDYLVSPVQPAALARALERVRRQVDAAVPAPGPRAYPAVLAIKVGEQFRTLEVSAIDSLAAEGNYVRIHTGKQSWLVRRALGDLADRLLDPARFVRIHRSTVVNLQSILAFDAMPHGEMEVILKSGRRLVCSRRHRPRLQERVEFLS